MSVLWNFAVFCGILTIVACQIPPDMQAKIDTLVSEFLKLHNGPAMGLSMVKNNGEILYQTGYGFRDIEEGSAADETTLFLIASVSKSFLATIVAKTLNELHPDLGEDALDTPIRQLVPKYNFTLGDRYRSESTTFRDLLAHRTCLLPEGLGTVLGPFETAAEFVYRQRYAPEICQFRTSFEYNNGIILMASQIIAFAADSTFEELLQELFNKIGMTDSTWVKNSDDHNSMPGRSVPYYLSDGKLVRLNPELLKPVAIEIASGGILSSARDMAKYMQFHLNRGRVGNTQVIPEQVMKWTQRASAISLEGSLKKQETDMIQLTYAYALCLELATYDGWQIVQHSGYTTPYESLMTLAPELQLGIFTTMSGPGSTSSENYSKFVLHTQLFDIIRGRNPSANFTMLQQKPKVTAGSQVSLTHKKRSVKKPFKSTFRAEPGDIVGNFGSPMSGQLEGSMRLNSNGDLQPYLSYGRWGQGWLTQVTPSSFEIKWDSDIVQVFVADGYTVGYMLEFLDVDTVAFTIEGYQEGTAFRRNVTLEDLPITPWDPESCGPCIKK